MDKPFKGFIHNWRKNHFDKSAVEKEYGEPAGLGYVITGTPQSHPTFQGWIRTSWIISHDETTGEVETRNSRYTLVGPEEKPE